MELKQLYQLAIDKGIAIEHFHLEANKALVCEYIPDSFAIAIDDRKIIDTTDETMCLAHELGHCETGAFYMAKSKFETRERCENRAFRWMVAHILPLPALKKAISEGLEEIWQLAEYFNLPEDFIKKAISYYQMTK